MHFVQVFVLYLAIGFNIINVEPLFQGFSIKKEFDVSLKPFVWKPISFIKEKFSPFGRFGVRHGIQKRELNALEPAPVIEHDLHAEPAPIGPFLTTVPVAKSEDVIVSPELIITPKPLFKPQLSSLPPASIIPSGNTAVTPFRSGTSFAISPFFPTESTPPSAVLITSVPIYRPDFQSTQIPLPTPEVGLNPIINPTALIAQSDMPAASIGQPLLPVSAPPFGAPRPFNYLFNTPVPLSIPPSHDGVGNLLHMRPGLSEVSQIQVPKPLSNVEQSPGLLADRAPINMVPAAIPIRSSVATNEVQDQRVVEEAAQSSGLLTDIGRADLINNYLNTVNRQPILSKSEVKDVPPISSNSIVPEIPSDSLLGNSALMRGTQMALRFSNIFVQLMSQFFSNARLTLSELPELRLKE